MRRKPVYTADVLRLLPIPMFTTADAAKLVPDDNMFLYRAAKKGYVKRIANRVYWNVLFSPAPPTVEQVTCFVRQPSYISCEWALHYHGVLLQSPMVCTAITLHSGIGKRSTLRFGDYCIEYSRMAERLYLFSEIVSLDGVLMATAEKALLDTIYLRRRIPFHDELEVEGLGKEKLKKLSALYPKSVQRNIVSLSER